MSESPRVTRRGSTKRRVVVGGAYGPKAVITAEWTVPLADEDKLDRLITYAVRIGLGEPFKDSFDPDLEKY